MQFSTIQNKNHKNIHLFHLTFYNKIIGSPTLITPVFSTPNLAPKNPFSFAKGKFLVCDNNNPFLILVKVSQGSNFLFISAVS
jgi:hypothetical protein